MKDKEKQRELIVEIMKADEKSGIYHAMKQTAVDWLVNEVANFIGFIPTDIIEKAKQMEKEQIEEAFLDGYKSHPYLAEQYYKENYGEE